MDTKFLDDDFMKIGNRLWDLYQLAVDVTTSNPTTVQDVYGLMKLSDDTLRQAVKKRFARNLLQRDTLLLFIRDHLRVADFARLFTVRDRLIELDKNTKYGAVCHGTKIYILIDKPYREVDDSDGEYRVLWRTLAVRADEEPDSDGEVSVYKLTWTEGNATSRCFEAPNYADITPIRFYTAIIENDAGYVYENTSNNPVSRKED